MNIDFTHLVLIVLLIMAFMASLLIVQKVKK
jgi:hypothetical protein